MTFEEERRAQIEEGRRLASAGSGHAPKRARRRGGKGRRTLSVPLPAAVHDSAAEAARRAGLTLEDWAAQAIRIRAEGNGHGRRSRRR